MTTCEMDTGTTPRATQAEWEWGKASAMQAIQAIQQPSSVSANDPRATPITPVLNPRHIRLATARSNHLSAIIADANELRQTPYIDEFGDSIETTKHAHEFCYRILVGAAITDAFTRQAKDRSCGVACITIPAAAVSSDERGGIRVEWVRDQASVHLVIPADSSSEPYIYIERGGEYKTVPATEVSLAEALRLID